MTISFSPANSIAGTANQDAEPPQIAVSGRNIYLVWHEFPTPASADPDIFFARSTNRGSSFSPRTNLSNSAAADSRDEDMAVSGGDIFVVWSEGGGTDVLLRKSTNNGDSFGAARKLNTATSAFRPQLKVDGSDVYVVWEAAGPGGFSDIFLAHSDNGGQSFGTESNVSNTPGDSEAPQLALSGDRIVVTWRDNSNPGLGFEIFTAQGK